jgi:hypothetical protein
MRIAILELIIHRGLARLTTGERLDIERVTSRSERGHWKRANFLGNALVPYSTPILVSCERQAVCDHGRIAPGRATRSGRRPALPVTSAR